MGFLDDTMASAVPTLKLIVGDELEALRESYRRIEGLKPGDKVRWKSEALRNQKFPALGEVAEVFAVFEPKPSNTNSGSNRYLREPDFSIALKEDDGDIHFFAYDSRHFERAE